APSLGRPLAPRPDQRSGVAGRPLVARLERETPYSSMNGPPGAAKRVCGNDPVSSTQLLQSMKTLVEAYFRLVKAVIVACLALMVILVFTNVVLRYGFGKGITVSDE